MNSAKIQAFSISIGVRGIGQVAGDQAAEAMATPKRRHSVITQNLYSYRRYKTWTQNIRAAIAVEST